ETWTAQTSGTTVGLNEVSFVDAETGTAVGFQGIILRTTDGGETWTLRTSTTPNDLYGVSFVDANIGIAVGHAGTMRRTLDGGATWTQQNSPTSNPLRAVLLVDVNTGTAVGFSGTILRTTDSGDTWTLQTSTVSDNLFGLSFVDTNAGTVVGVSGTILGTTDGGGTWTVQSDSSTHETLWGVSCVDANRGWAVGGRVMHTTDGGATWRNQGYGGVAASFVDANTGWVVGENTILHTADGGATWTRQSIPTVSICRCLFFPTQPIFSGVSFADANTGAVVGRCRTDIIAHNCIDIGLLLQTTDGGNTWVYSRAGRDASATALRAISFADAQRAIGVGDGRGDVPPFFWGSTVRTTDGGASWQVATVLLQMNYSVVLNGVSYADANTATAVGYDSNPVSGGGLIIRTTDGGATWTRQSSGTAAPLYGVSFVDANTGT